VIVLQRKYIQGWMVENNQEKWQVDESILKELEKTRPGSVFRKENCAYPFFFIVNSMFGKTYTIPYSLKYLFVFLITSSKSGNSST
jgi:hypothetical protein